MTSGLFNFIVLVSVAVTYAQVNDFDQPFDFQCGYGKVLSFIYSYHEDKYEDRRWYFSCRNVGSTRECYTTDYVNEFDKPVSFTCRDQHVITGIASYNDDYYKDRRFKFTCCAVNSWPLSGCYPTDFLNAFDKPLTLNVPNDQGIKHIYSEHDNYYEDRKWRFQMCKL
ncbi:hypothetical protein Btru_017232 [Bulinus truncatus]|nr:hypothetical protein Btru_017232 [Bulinus truncatus]